ncbi:MAG: hypothetical protein GPJ54_18565 [Candidatus Heimdallarchaeota archaeon]|nr:hypothetical protein [Candidatus Heimdallarchaeota archaeon]
MRVKKLVELRGHHRSIDLIYGPIDTDKVENSDPPRTKPDLYLMFTILGAVFIIGISIYILKRRRLIDN